jgi:hypothetical protein
MHDVWLNSSDILGIPILIRFYRIWYSDHTTPTPAQQLSDRETNILDAML